MNLANLTANGWNYMLQSDKAQRLGSLPVVSTTKDRSGQVARYTISGILAVWLRNKAGPQYLWPTWRNFLRAKRVSSIPLIRYIQTRFHFFSGCSNGAIITFPHLFPSFNSYFITNSIYWLRSYESLHKSVKFRMFETRKRRILDLIN